jgi:hypothetical protein
MRDTASRMKKMRFCAANQKHEQKGFKKLKNVWTLHPTHKPNSLNPAKTLLLQNTRTPN